MAVDVYKRQGYESPLAMTLEQCRMKKETLDAMFTAMREYLPKFWEYFCLLYTSILGMLRPAVVALIASAGVSILVTAFWPEGIILIQKTQIDMVIIFIAAVYLIQFRKMNPVLVMVLSGVAKLGIYLVGTFLL